MLHWSFALPDLELPEEEEEEKEEIILEDFGKLLSKQDANDEKVLHCSKLNTINLENDILSNEESIQKAESEQNS